LNPVDQVYWQNVLEWENILADEIRYFESIQA
jgi:hypothetical protein